MHLRRKFILIAVLTLLLAAGFSNIGFKNAASPGADSLRLQKAMKSFRLEPGMRIDLIASEPLVVDPVVLAFDEKRRMYVVEDRGYPDPPEGGTPTRLGRVALLEDRNGDGKYDHRSEFATGLTYPNGIMVWKGGVFVTCAPDVYYFKDTDGDGVADIRQVVLTGFSSTRTAQIRVSHPTLGLDGKVYLTSGLNNGEVISPLHPDRPAVAFSASDSRFDPDSYEFETTGGRSQFGLTFDAFGRRFGCSNRHPVQQIVLEPWHLRRNPQLSFTETIENVSKVEAEATVFPISGATTSADFIPKLIGLSHTGTFTAASGVMIFNGTGLSEGHRGNVFICESAQNLVQRQVMVPNGVSFKSELAYSGKEFLSSTDEWFRPVFLQHGPEGGLYIADMHRKVIDHPSYVPEEARGGLDFESGKTDGRIYRIVRQDFADKKLPQTDAFSGSSQKIAALLNSPEEWDRQTAHRILLERADKSVAPELRTIATGAVQAESRVRALWLLSSLGVLDEPTLKRALSDKMPGVREQAVLLAGKLVTRQPALLTYLASKADDADARVRFTAALVLGSFQGEQVVSALAKIAARDGADRWVRAAVLSGIDNRLRTFLTAFRMQKNGNQQAFSAVMQDLGQLFGNNASEADSRLLLNEMISSSGDHKWRMATLLGLAEGISKRMKADAASKGLLYQILGSNASPAEKLAMEKFVEKAVAVAMDVTQQTNSRNVAAGLLGYTGFDKSQKALRQLMDARNPSEIQLTAIASLARIGDKRGAEMLTEKATWSNYTPRVKSAVIAALVSRPEYVRTLFNAIESGTIAAAEISSTDRQRLIKSKDQMLSKKAAELFKDLEGGGRMTVYQNYRSILSGNANAARGKAVFQRACSSCHTYAGAGGKVGPDLTGVRNQPPDALLLHILVPNYEVLPAYQAIAVETTDGRSLSGWLMAETESSLTLKTAFGTQESVLRKNIKMLSNSGLSLMPDGLEQTMTKEELAELIAYLKKGDGER